MLLVELTSTPLEDLPLEAFKGHLQLGRGFTDDGLQDEVLESYLRAAIASIEARIGKMLYSRRVSWTLTRWAEPCAQALPVAPVTELHELSVTTYSGTERVIEPESYTLLKDTHRPKLSTAASLPAIPHSGTATLTFQAGHSASWSGIPADLREAVFLMAAHYYENRSDKTGSAGLMPFGVMSLLEAHRNVRLMGGLR